MTRFFAIVCNPDFQSVNGDPEKMAKIFQDWDLFDEKENFLTRYKYISCIICKEENF